MGGARWLRVDGAWRLSGWGALAENGWGAVAEWVA